ncbi:hypothetical protein BGW37DRAFT_470315 [Umbelopsis sp. PMI_123]|nr:hypothetical protein BGW37DRAFT_470315 [Umbelopsis sp. PMI_123]
MTITYSSGCGVAPAIPSATPLPGWDSCYANFIISEPNCTITITNEFVPCQCDTSGNCKGVSVAGDNSTAAQALPCNGQPIPFPNTTVSGFSVSGSCTYKKAASTTSTNGGITLTKSSILIAASLVLCAVVGSF